ncbi:MAG: Acetyl-CoA synthetase [Thermococcus sibiricus]|uniref:acetate--CoA ligase (ADP-forming) n=2 Tax=Thermococcus sibiricus TaxID=172049 RepID=A0A117L1J4_9EURY|nr:MAG: Acetyl-CoA synthetase [Thermococcus sibiricus]KUK29042.1 MAG: Acetyl-CoA synthetase [Thermococcus sp. 40_45]
MLFTIYILVPILFIPIYSFNSIRNGKTFNIVNVTETVIIIIEVVDMDRVAKAREIIEKARAENRPLVEPEAKEILQLYGVPVPEFKVATNEEEAVQFAREIGYPVVMKIVSPQIIHKSDAGGVKVNIKSDEEAKEAFNTIMKNAKNYKPDANLWGVIIYRMLPLGKEIIIGMIRDPQFGPAIMFGLGGIFVEILKDVSFRVAPISKDEALEMIKEIKAYPILAGARGEKPVNTEALAEIIMKVGELALELPEVKELDINPVFAYEDSAVAVDARILL